MSSELSVLGSVEELAGRLLDLQLVSPTEMRRCRSALPRSASGAELLQMLEGRELVTSYQARKIEKGEAEQLVIGGCKLMYQNASGSFARLYRAARLDNGQMIGIKVLRDRWAKDPDAVLMFRREGELGKRLKHPNIVPIFDVGSSGKFHYITMEFVEGGNLKDFLKIRGKLAPLEALQYTLHICRALEAALAMGLTHRDMKATNVLMSSQGVAKLIDFGLAADDAPAGRGSNAELAQAIEYSTLEKNTGAPKNDPRSDLFFLGTILYELLTGEPPYPRTKDREERRKFSRYRDIRPVTSIDAALPRSAAGIVDRLLLTSPAARYQTPTEVIQDVEAALKELGQPSTSKPEPTALAADAKVILCVEHRANRQDVLRDYFSKRGYRLVLLADADRALARLKTMTPRGIVLFGDAMGERIAQDYPQALSLTEGQPVAVLAVLSDAQRSLAKKLPSHARGVVLQQPTSLRDLRQSIEKVLKKIE
ncbi:serine/threonine protein kinase [Planctomicrobium piriforme]|uniref:Protein kinase domain-containing protein n=1 Tax=Planctomicrobium piriforme TaxID=1576369 RepID=A0A1I3HQY7_9PLAN|nr:serine/threonine-protein kinase [Planctomicrobium piriforme]SFI38043.1 hypothetical protein/serine/threonine protein kinase [Planctomicrobium piriforme]